MVNLCNKIFTVAYCKKRPDVDTKGLLAYKKPTAMLNFYGLSNQVRPFLETVTRTQNRA
jgi:hypothetical protein